MKFFPQEEIFFAVDQTIIPTPAAWRIGIETGKKLLNYYLEKHGRYPESCGQWLWSLDGYKGDGEQLAQVLYLVGTKPIWNPDGSIKCLEVIPLEELGRPRIDIAIKISGIVRDILPNYIYLIDEAISKVVSLDEPLDLNYVRMLTCASGLKKTMFFHLRRLLAGSLKLRSEAFGCR